MATQTINIRRDVTDPFYRYKMEKLQSKIEGKGNGIKSVIVNLTSIANSLSRPPVYVVKFFGFELGAQTNTGSDDRWIINGAHEAAKLQDYLDSFITKFVLCKECKNPETDLSISKDQQIIRNCKACGQRTTVDPRLKLSSYIIKNPPQNLKEKKSKDKKDKKGRTPSEDPSKEGSNSEEEAQNGNGAGPVQATSNLDQYAGDAGSDDELTRRIQADAEALPTADGSGDAKNDQWAVDMSEEAVKARAEGLSTDLKRTLVFGGEEDDDEGDGEAGNTPYDQLGQWILEEKGKSGSVDDIEIFKKAVDLGIEKKHRTLIVLAQALFTKDIIKEIPKNAGLLKKLCSGSDRHERALLGGFERFVGKEHPELIATVPKILHQFYDQDILSEEAIQKWGSRASKKYVDLPTSKKVRKAAEPFLKWLEEADEDTEEEEDDDDDE